MTENRDKGLHKSVINWYPGHMAKAKREIQEKINLIDVVFEVIDARIPYSSKNKDIDPMIRNKPKLLIMTKTSLCDRVATNKWLQYYEKQNYQIIMIDLLDNPNLNSILKFTNNLASDMNKKRQAKGLQPRRLRILILGIPNVGKSTLINRLVNKKAVKVGNKPGITKNLEWIRLNKDLELLDTPGILWPRLDNLEVSYNLAATDAIKEEVLNKEEVATYLLNKLIKNYSNNLIARYDIKNITNLKNCDINLIWEAIAKKIGAFKNDEMELDKVYTKLLKDFRDGYLKGVTLDDYEDRKI